MLVDEYRRTKGEIQDARVIWISCTENRYEEMLGILPPAYHSDSGFLVGEPTDHHAMSCKPRYLAFICRRVQLEGCAAVSYFYSSRPMTVEEFIAITSEKWAN